MGAVSTDCDVGFRDKVIGVASAAWSVVLRDELVVRASDAWRPISWGVFVGVVSASAGVLVPPGTLGLVAALKHPTERLTASAGGSPLVLLRLQLEVLAPLAGRGRHPRHPDGSTASAGARCRMVPTSCGAVCRVGGGGF